MNDDALMTDLFGAPKQLTFSETFEGLFGPSDQTKKLQQRTEELKSSPGKSVAEQWSETPLPYLGSLNSWTEQRRLGDANARFQRIEATDEDINLLATANRQAEVTKGQSVVRQFAGEAVKLPALLGEFTMGGSAVRGLGVVKGTGVGSKALAGALATPAVPSTYAEGIARNQIEHPDENTFQQAAPPLAMAMAQNAVLGQLQSLFSGANITRAGRIGAKTGIGMAEAQAADTALTGLDRVTKEVTDKSLGLDTKWGTIGALARGDEGAGKQAAVQFLTFSVFSAMHSGREGREINVEHVGPDLRTKFQRATEAAKPEQVAEVGKQVQEGKFDPETPGPVGDLGRAYSEVVKTAKPASPLDRLTKEEVQGLAKGVGLSEKAFRARGGEEWVRNLVDELHPPAEPKAPEPAKPSYLTPEKPAEASPEPPGQVPIQGEIAAPGASGEAAGAEKGPGVRVGDPMAPEKDANKNILTVRPIIGPDGERYGNVKYFRSGDTIKFDWGGKDGAKSGDPAAKGTLGVEGMLAVVRQIAAEHPDAILATWVKGDGRLGAGKRITVNLARQRAKVVGQTVSDNGQTVSAAKEPVTGFTTAKGSTYQVHEDGTTTRNKAARNLPGHEGDSGAKQRSEKTIFVQPGVASALSAAGLSGLGLKRARLVIKDGKATLLTWNKKENRWGAAPSGRDIPFTTKPEVGLHPLELWDKADDVPGYEAYRNQHAGNPIVSLESKAAAPKIGGKSGPIEDTVKLIPRSLKGAMKKAGLHTAEAEVLVARLNPEGEMPSFEELAGTIMGKRGKPVTRERMQQIETEAIKKLVKTSGGKLPGSVAEIRAALGFGAKAAKGGEVAATDLHHAPEDVAAGRKEVKGRLDKQADKLLAEAGFDVNGEPIGAAPAKKQSRRESVQAIVTRLGGIDPKSHAFLTHFSSVKEARENGINLKVFRKGGRGLDQLAQEMHARGELPDANTQTLIDALQRGELAHTADRTVGSDEALNEHWRKDQEKHDAEVAAAKEHDAGVDESPLSETEAYLADASFDFGAPNPARAMPPSNREAGTTGGGQSNAGEGTGPSRDHTSALANAKVDAARAERGLPPLLSAARKSNPKTWDEAMAAIDRDPRLPGRLMDELVTNPRPTTTVESAVLLHELVNLKNQNDAAVIEANRLNQEAVKLRVSDPEAAKEKFAEFNRASAVEADTFARLEVLDRVVRNQGTEAGRYLQFRRQLVKEDYTLSSMLLRAERIKGDKLTADEKAEIIETQKKLADAEEKLAAAEDRAAKAEAEKANQPEPTEPAAALEPGLLATAVKWLKDLFRPKIGARSKTWEYADQLEQSAVAELSKKMKGDISFSNFDPTLIVPLAKYAAAKIIKTGLTFADFTKGLVNKFGEDVKPHLDAIWKQAQEHAKGTDDMAGLRIAVKTQKTKFNAMTDRLKRESQTPLRRALGNVGEAFNVSRSLVTSFDLSAVLRQGAFVSFGRPLTALKAIPEMFRALASEGGFQRVQDALEQRPNRTLYNRSGLYLAETSEHLNKQEEGFVGRWTKKIPGIAASQRAYTAFLNRVRADVFDAMIGGLAMKGIPTAKEAKAVANFVNVATGRGKLTQNLERAAGSLAQVFFSPRYAVSRFQLLIGQPFMGGTNRTRVAIAKEYARALVGLGVFYTVMKLANDDETITFDPRSSDFGKVKIRNTRIDPLAGLSQTAVFVAKLVSGEKVDAHGKTVDLRGPKVPYAGETVQDVVSKFVRNKLAPVPGAAADILTGKDAVGKPTTASGVAGRLVTPMAVSDVYEAMKDLGLPRGAAVSLLAILGMGSQTYESKPLKK